MLGKKKEVSVRNYIVRKREQDDTIESSSRFERLKDVQQDHFISWIDIFVNQMPASKLLHIIEYESTSGGQPINLAMHNADSFMATTISNVLICHAHI